MNSAPPPSLAGLRFFAAVSLPAVPWLCVVLLPQQPQWAAWLPLLLIHAAIPLVDALVGDDPTPAGPGNSIQRLWPILCLPAWLAALFWAAARSPALDVTACIGSVLSMGAIGGVVAINAAHELIHRNSRFERGTGAVLLASVCYGAFKVEHVRGHHLWVGTARDTASARRGQSVYQFVPASIAGTVSHAWRLEQRRLAQHPRWARVLRNETLQLGMLSVLLLLATGLAWGIQAALYVGLVSLVAIIELEIINYIEHYGLRRQLLSNGRYEPVEPRHSWNANSRVLNAYLFNLQRHSDHHAHAGKPYPALDSQVDAPMLPAGYGAMMLLALVPPLWSSVMDHRLETWASKSTH